MLTPVDPCPVGTVLRYEPLVHNTGNQATGGIWRVHGSTGTAILKHATAHGTGSSHWTAGTDPEHWNYWRREYLAYRTGFVRRYVAGTGLTAAEPIAIRDRPDGSVELWLSDVDGVAGPAFSVARLGRFAHDLGVAQARMIDVEDPPAWLSRRFLRHYSGGQPVTEPVNWDHEQLARYWPARLRDGLRDLWTARFALFDLAERLPRTVCHLDVWPANLIGVGDGTVLLDWSFVGYGAIGEDIGNLIPDTVNDGLMDVDRLPEIAETVTRQYIAGLREGGWRGSTTDVRRAIALCGAAKYVWLAPRMVNQLDAGTSTRSPNYDPDSDDATVFVRRRSSFALMVSWMRESLR